MLPRPPSSTLFPYTTLFRSDPWLSQATGIAESTACGTPLAELYPELLERGLLSRLRRVADDGNVEVLAPAFHQYLDRKSTRLNSSHSQISYAVFCLKKKKKK